MAVRKCPNCEEGALYRKSTSTNKDKEYVILYFLCDTCEAEHQLCEIPRERVNELLRYEKAYWKMKDLLEKYY